MAENQKAEPPMPGAIKLSLSRRLVGDPSPTTANKFLLIAVGTDILLEVGNIDLMELHSELAKPEEIKNATLNISHRFVLNVPALLDLNRLTRELIADMDKRGMLDKKALRDFQGV